ncbi:MAG: CgeB family protein [Gemmatimonadales bacterium]
MKVLPVLVVASFDEAHHAHAAQRCRALERLGCRVEVFDLLKRPGLLGRLAGNDLRSRLLRSVEAANARLVLVIGAPELEPDLVTTLRKETRLPWANWFPDDLRTAYDACRRAAAYDHVFVTGSDVAARMETELGRPVEVVPFAADPSVYRPLRSKDQYRANVVFAGSATPRRELLLTGLTGFGLALWGPGWRRTTLKDYCRGEVASTDDYVRAYGGASVAVNIHHTAGGNGADEGTVNQRLFEIAAIGVPQVVDARADLPAMFQTGEQVMVFQDAAELRSLVEAALHDLPSMEPIAAAARREALARHTYMHRLTRIVDSVTR